MTTVPEEDLANLEARLVLAPPKGGITVMVHVARELVAEVREQRARAAVWQTQLDDYRRQLQREQRAKHSTFRVMRSQRRRI